MEKSNDELIKVVYEKLLFRDPDSEGYLHFLHLLETKEIDENKFIEMIKNSDEYKLKQKAEYFNKQKKYVFTDNYDLKYIINPNSVLDNLLTQRGSIDENLINLTKNHLEKNGIIFDVGANAGFLSLPFARYVVPKGNVYSFEPDSELYDQLRENIKLNELQNIHINKLALQDDSSMNTIQLQKRRAIHDDGRTNFGLSTIQNNPEYVIGSEFVQTDTIDNFLIFNNVSNVNLIKIDVEGAEFRVLKGAKDTITKFYPKIIYEFSHTIDKLTNTKNTKNCFDYLKKFGYKQFRILPNENLELLLKYDASLEDCDILCVQKI
jgi:FkbM family methyltransferase